MVMKSSLIFRLSTVLLSAVIFGGFVHSAAAQPPDPDFPQWREIAVHNIPPSLLAYRLDPTDYPLPAKYFPKPSPPAFFERNPPVKLNPVDKNLKIVAPDAKPFEARLSPDDSGKTLWILSTEKAFDQIKFRADSLDTAIPQIKITLQVVVINPDDLKKIKLQPPDPKITFSDDSASRTMLIAGDGETILNQLAAQGKAKIIDSSHVTTANDYYSVISSTDSSIPVAIGIKNGDGNYEAVGKENDPNQQLFLEKRFVREVLPDVNGIGSISVLLIISSNEVLTHKTPSGTYDTLWVKSLQEKPAVSTLFAVDDGQTAMLPGYNSTELGIDDKNQNVVLFVTADIVDD